MISNIGTAVSKRRVRFMNKSEGPTTVLIQAYLTVKLLTGSLTSIDVTSLIAAERLDPEIAGLAIGLMRVEGINWITIKETSIEVHLYPAFDWEADNMLVKIAQVIKDEVFGGQKIEIDYFPMSLKPRITKTGL